MNKILNVVYDLNNETSKTKVRIWYLVLILYIFHNKLLFPLCSLQEEMERPVVVEKGMVA